MGNAEGRGDDEDSSISNGGSSSESSESLGLESLQALNDILVRGGGYRTLFCSSLQPLCLNWDTMLNCVLSCSLFSSMLAFSGRSKTSREIKREISADMIRECDHI